MTLQPKAPTPRIHHLRRGPGWRWPRELRRKRRRSCKSRCAPWAVTCSSNRSPTLSRRFLISRDALRDRGNATSVLSRLLSAAKSRERGRHWLTPSTVPYGWSRRPLVAATAGASAHHVSATGVTRRTTAAADPVSGTTGSATARRMGAGRRGRLAEALVAESGALKWRSPGGGRIAFCTDCMCARRRARYLRARAPWYGRTVTASREAV